VVGVKRISGVSGIIASERVMGEGGDGGVKAGGVPGGGMHGDGVSGISGVSGVAWLERGERKNLLSSSGSRSCLTSLRLFLTRLARGNATSGGDGGGSVAGAFSQDGPAVTGDDGCGQD
jgi:hypothetical protein